MKKLIVLSVIMAVTLLTWGSVAPAHAQDSAKDDKPTFYRLTPGVYVNGWPRCTVRYPKEWVERFPEANLVFRVSAPGPGPLRSFAVADSGSSPLPLDRWADWVVAMFRRLATDVTVLSDKPSRLHDGTPAQEVEIRAVVNGAPLYNTSLATKKGDLLITMAIESTEGRIGEDLKAILYSIEFEPDKDKPVKVPPDAQELLDRHCSASVAHDVAKVMSHYSDGFLNSGMRKGEVERFHRQIIGFITSCEIVITDFVPAADRAYLAGFVSLGSGRRVMLREISIIKENGEWKWYGNQRDSAR
jgi:hypothetical protein